MLIAGFLIGFLGSLHCLGMCGPIAMAMHTGSGFKSLVYNSGRVVSYASIGAVLGVIGSGATIFGIQRHLSIVVGVVVLLIVLVPQLRKINVTGTWNQTILSPLRKMLSSVVNKQSMPSYFAAGMLNGLLPCGLVYLAASTAIASGSVSNAMITMIAFGIGTWPMMLGIGWGTSFANGNSLISYLKKNLSYVIPVFAVLMGSVLIIRGMALDIPYLSPALSFAGLGPTIPVCQ